MIVGPALTDRYYPKTWYEGNLREKLWFQDELFLEGKAFPTGELLIQREFQTRGLNCAPLCLIFQVCYGYNYLKYNPTRNVVSKFRFSFAFVRDFFSLPLSCLASHWLFYWFLVWHYYDLKRHGKIRHMILFLLCFFLIL